MNTIETVGKYKGQLKKKFGVSRIGVIGLYAEDRAKGHAGMEVLVELEEGYRNFDNYIKLQTFLEEVLGRTIDIVPSSKACKFCFKKGLFQEVKYA